VRCTPVKVHAHEVHTHEMHAREMHAHDATPMTKMDKPSGQIS
jgi:hypothetical protein